MVGITGPRWLLRATLFGRPAVEHDDDGHVGGTRSATSSCAAAPSAMPPGERAAADDASAARARTGPGLTDGDYAGRHGRGQGPAPQEPQPWASQRRAGGPRAPATTQSRRAAARSPSATTASGSRCRAPCARSRCARAAACPPSRPSCTTAPALITLVWLGRRRIAGIEPGRAIKVDGPDRRPRRDPGDVQPALRAAGPEPIARHRTASTPGAGAGRRRRSRPSVRAQLSRRSAAAAACSRPPSRRSLFTVTFLITTDLRLALGRRASARRCVLLVVRLVQRSTVQFVLNAWSASAIGAFFAWRAARGGGDAERPGAGLLPARHDLQRRLRRR